MPTKICNCCNKEKSVDDFQIVRKNGNYKRHHLCINCRRDYDVNYHFNRSAKQKKIKQELQDKRKRFNIDYIKAYKSELGCCKCGEKDWACLDFHHISDDKEFNIGDAQARATSIKRLMLEIKKCVVICANCHRKLHRDEKQTVAQRESIPFGTEGSLVQS